MNKRNKVIDILKLIFVFIIFINHSNTLIQPGEKISTIMHLGFLGVEFFFIVSGYLMLCKADNVDNANLGESTLSFIVRKISIFLPYYIIAWIIGFGISHINNFSLKVILKDFIMSFFAIMQLEMAGFKTYQVLGPTWYLSSMLLSMLLLYPLALKFKRNYTLLVAPIIAIMCYGYLSINIGKLATITQICAGGIYSGVFRGLGGISLGCLCYEMVKKLKKYELTTFGKSFVTLIEIVLYIIAWMAMNWKINFRLDFIIVIVFLLAVTISFSGQSYTKNLIKGNLNWIGSFSLSLYLVDAIARKCILILLPNSTRDERILPCFLFWIVFGLIVKFGGDQIKLAYSNIKKKIEKKFFI